jgi:glutamyl-tRNA synthetase
LGDIIEKGQFILAERPFTPDEKAAKNLDSVSRGILGELTPHLQTVSWDRDAIEAQILSFAEARDLKFGKLAGPLRAALSGRTATPSVFDMMAIIGREETIARLSDAAA